MILTISDCVERKTGRKRWNIAEKINFNDTVDVAFLSETMAMTCWDFIDDPRPAADDTISRRIRCEKSPCPRSIDSNESNSTVQQNQKLITLQMELKDGEDSLWIGSASYWPWFVVKTARHNPTVPLCTTNRHSWQIFGMKIPRSCRINQVRSQHIAAARWGWVEWTSELWGSSPSKNWLMRPN